MWRGCSEGSGGLEQVGVWWSGAGRDVEGLVRDLCGEAEQVGCLGEEQGGVCTVEGLIRDKYGGVEQGWVWRGGEQGGMRKGGARRGGEGRGGAVWGRCGARVEAPLPPPRLPAQGHSVTPGHWTTTLPDTTQKHCTLENKKS